MVTAFATADATALVGALPLAGKPKMRPLVRGALIIVRLSRPKEKMSSLTMQERHCRTYATQQGLEVLGVYQDIMSGLIPGVAREGYQDAMQRARARLASHVIVYDFDRFSREGVASMVDYEMMEARQIEMHDTLNGYIDHETAARKAVESHNEVRKTSRRVMDNMQERHMNPDDYDSPRRPPFGYWTNPMTEKREPDPRWVGEGAHDPRGIAEGEHIISALFRRFDAGESKSKLRAWFNATTGRQARGWSISNLLRNEYYTGIDVYNRRSCSKIHGKFAKPPEEWSTRLHDHPLVDMTLFKRVQTRLETYKGQGRSRTGGKPAAYALHGIVRCAHCTYTQHGQTRHVSLRGQRHGVPLRVEAQCPVCHRSRVYGRVEDAVLRALATIPLGADAIALGQHAPGADGAGDPTRRLEALTRRIEKARAQRGRLINRRDLDPDDPDYLDPDDYRLAMIDNKRELDDLEAQRAVLAQGAGDDTSAEAVLQWLSTLSSWTEVLDPDETTPEQRRRVYGEAVATVLLDFDANAATVHWLPAIARLAGVPSITLPIARGKLSKKQTQHATSS